MTDSPLTNPVLWTTGLTALVAAMGLLYTVWQDHRRLRITLTPVRWAHTFPVDAARTKSRVVFIVALHLRNPGKTPNAIVTLTAWRDDTPVEAFLPSGGSLIEAHGRLSADISIVVFDAIEDVRAAYDRIGTITVEVRALRGARRSVFERDAFRRSD